jgi:DNA-binding transcriptional ArsR family regulator
MPRSATTTDAFSAIAEPRRREILNTLAESNTEHDVTWLVEQLGWPQPQVSKHLGVLRQVGLVRVTRDGRRRLYSVSGRTPPVYDWDQVLRAVLGAQAPTHQERPSNWSENHSRIILRQRRQSSNPMSLKPPTSRRKE